MANLKKTDPNPGAALRAAREAQGLSLRALSARVSIPFSTLSKLENGKMSMTYDYLVLLTQGLGVDLGALVSGGAAALRPPAIGRRSVSRAGQWADARSERHQHHYLAAELRGKMMVPIIIDVTARSVEAMGGLVGHVGEEYLQVLTGTMEMHSQLYEPLRLSAGDSVYFDSAMPHAYVRVGDDPCRVLSVCAGESIQRLAQSAGETWRLVSAAGSESPPPE